MTSKRKFSFRMLLASAVVFSVLAGPGFMGKAQAECSHRSKNCMTSICFLGSNECWPTMSSYGADGGCGTVTPCQGSCGTAFKWSIWGCDENIGGCGGGASTTNC